MSFIGSFAQGDWIKGLSEMFGGSLGGHIADTARGNQSIGEMFGNMGKQAAIEAPMAIATMGVGAAAGAAASGLAKAAQAGAQVGKAATIGTKIASGASKVLQSVSNIMGGGSLLNIGKNGGNLTGAAADVAGDAGTKAAATTVNGQLAPVPEVSSGAHSIGGQLSQQFSKAPSLKPKADVLGPSPSLRPKASTGSNIKSNIGKIAGQFGVQGALSLLSVGMAAKQAKASNNMAQQSLQFQKQTYNEQIAEKENYKTSMKESAGRAYESSLLFGSTLKDSDSNSAILTSYNTGTAGDYSILTYSSSKSRDKT